MEVDRGVDFVFPEVDKCLGVNHHNPSLLCDGTDHALSNTVVMVRVMRARFICCAAGSEHRAECRVIILSSAILTLQTFVLIALAQSINSGLIGLVGGSASFRLPVREHLYRSEAGIVVNQ
jgi:hypothetical protein